MHRRFQPNHLFHEGLQIAIRVGAQLVPDILVFDQQLHACRQRIGRRLAAAHEGVRHHFCVQLIVVQRPPPAFYHGVDQHADQRPIRMLAKPLEDGLEIMLRFNLPIDHRHFLVFGQHHRNPLEKGIRPALDLPHILALCAHLLADDEQRQRHAELPHPFAAPIGHETIDQLIG